MMTIDKCPVTPDAVEVTHTGQTGIHLPSANFHCVSTLMRGCCFVTTLRIIEDGWMQLKQDGVTKARLANRCTPRGMR